MLTTPEAKRWGQVGGTCAAHRAAMVERVRECRAKYQKCADAGMTRRQAAQHLGLSRSAVKHAAWRYGIRFKGDT